MMQKKTSFYVLTGLFSLLLLSGTVFARQMITLEEAYTSAVSHSERIKISDEGLFQAREEVLRKKKCALSENNG